MADLTITTAQQVRLNVSAVTPSDTVPTSPAATWSTSDATKVSLLSDGDPDTIIAVGVGIGTSTVTATSGLLTKDFIIDVVSSAATALTIAAETPLPKDDKQRTRGRGLGIGAQ